MPSKNEHLESIDFINGESKKAKDKANGGERSYETAEDVLDIEEFTKVVEDRIDRLFREDSEFMLGDDSSELPHDEVEREITDSEISHQGDDTIDIPAEHLHGITTPLSKVEMVQPVTLAELVEQANVTYLSLDWEFSKENLDKMHDAVVKIESFITPVPKVKILFDILKILLLWFKNHEEVVSAVSLNLFKDTLQLMSKVVRKGQEFKDNELLLVDQFARRFQIIKKQYKLVDDLPKVSEEKPSTVPTVEKPPVEVVQDKAAKDIEVPSEEILPEERAVKTPEVPTLIEEKSMEPSLLEPAVSTPAPAQDVLLKAIESAGSIEEFKKCLLAVRQSIQKENEKFRHVIKVLEKKPKLAPLADRLKMAVSRYDKFVDHMDRLGEKIMEVWSGELEKYAASVVRAPMKAVGEIFDQPSEELPVEKKVVSEPEEAQDIREVYIFLCQGKYFAIPAESMVKFDQISSKKASLLVTRGEAYLKDFIPFWKSVKDGLRGKWRNLTKEELKGLSFRYVNIQHLFNLPGGKYFHGGIVVLASYDDCSVMFFADSMMIESPVKVKEFMREKKLNHVLGTVTVGKRSAEVLDIKSLIA